MSAHGFRSVFMVGAIVGTALSCYLVSLRVASERAALESVENKIVLAQRDIRLLETEIGTRGRLAQLERWNVRVIRLSAPSADQFVEGAFQLATLAKPDRTPAIEAPVVLAAAPLPATRQPDARDETGAPAPRPARPLNELIHVAGYSKPTPAALRAEAAPKARPVAKSAPAKPATKPVKSATADPLAPLSGGATKAKIDGGDARDRTVTSRLPKDSSPR